MYKPSRWYIKNSGEPIGDPMGFGKYQDPTTALVVGGASLAGGLLQADASKSAAGQQASAANRATDTQLQMFNTINNQNAPYRQAGANAVNQLGIGLGLPGYSNGAVSYNGQNFASKSALNDALYSDYLGQVGGDASKVSQDAIDKVTARATPVGGSDPNSGYFTHQFGANDLNANLAPNYQFQLDQGLGAVKNAGNLQSGLISGNTLKGVNDYAQNFAGNAYQNAYNNYTANQNNIFNRLATIAGIGTSANTTSANAGTTTAGNVGNAQMAAGAAQAAGTVGSANALSGGVQNASSWYALPSILKAVNSGGALDT